MRLSLSLPLLLLLLHSASSKKILLYNVKFGHSHSNFMGRLADILAAAGHQVTTLIPEIDVTLKDGTTNTTIIRIPVSPKASEKFDLMMNNPDANFFTLPLGHPLMPLMLGTLFSATFSSQCEATVNHPGLIDKLTNEHFDIMINENFDYCGTGTSSPSPFHSPPPPGLAHVVKPSALVIVSSTNLFENIARDIGVPVQTTYVPGFMTIHVDPHSLWSRFRNRLNVAVNSFFFDMNANGCNAVFREKFGPSFPSMAEITSKAALVLTNGEPLIDHGAPTLKKIVDLGGIGAKSPVPLDEYWNKILSLRKRTVLVSFGSIAKAINMPGNLRYSVLQSLASFPDVTFIWKYEDLKDDFALNHASKVDNVVLSSWMPQNDLLADPCVVAFVSHAGMGSVYEAALHGVPALFVPLFAEQPRNAGTMEMKGMAKVFDKFQLGDPAAFTAAVADLLEDENRRLRARSISRLLAARPFSPTQLLLKHISFVGEFGGVAELTPRVVEMSVVERNDLDLVAIAIVLVVVLVYSIFCCLRCSKRRILRIKDKKE